MAWLPREMLDEILTNELGDLISGARLSHEDVAEQFFTPPLPFLDIDWNEGQRAAIEAIVAWRRDPTAPRICKLVGAAGTGKTTVLQELRCRLHGTRTAWSAMTGKAASRMREAAGVNGRTFHSVVFHQPREVDNVVDQKIDLEFDRVKVDGRSCLLVVDEASMVSPRLRKDIDRSGYDKVLLVGDPYQIPPVLSKREEEENGADYSVFAEVEGPLLSEVMRASGAVLAAATYVRERQRIPMESQSGEGGVYIYEEASSPEAVTGRAITSWFEDPEGHALITWRNEQRLLANKVIRKKLGFVGDQPEEGEVVIVRKNVYGGEGDLMNGDAVTIVEWSSKGPTIAGIETQWASVAKADKRVVTLLIPTSSWTGTLPYVGLDKWKRALEDADVPEPIPVTYSYCLTGHLAQGSEYRRVTTFLPGDLNNPHFRKLTKLPTGEHMLFSMRFLYTALARAKQHTSLIVSR